MQNIPDLPDIYLIYHSHGHSHLCPMFVCCFFFNENYSVKMTNAHLHCKIVKCVIKKVYFYYNYLLDTRLVSAGTIFLKTRCLL